MVNKYISLIIYIATTLSLINPSESSEAENLNEERGQIKLDKDINFNNYKGQNRSQLNWQKLNIEKWLDYKDWLTEVARKDANPLWKEELRDQSHHEKMGRVIKCMGECRVYRGKGFSIANYRSLLLEGDEVRTLTDSFIWIFLMDGTLVRLGPNTSITLREINFGNKEIFLQARLNEGLIFWSSREHLSYQENNLAPTDIYFHPLALSEANPDKNVRDYDEEDLGKYIEDNQANLQHVKKLNHKIQENNKKIIQMETKSFLIMPNGTVFGGQIHLDAFIGLGGPTYLHIRNKDSLSLTENENENEANENSPATEAEFYFRGYNNQQVESIKPGIWYRVDAKGREIAEFPEGQKMFHFVQILTKRITSIALAREFFLERYSLLLYQKEISSRELAMKFGYKLWGAMEDQESDMKRHYDFLKEYSRRSETTNLNSSFKLRKILQKTGEEGIEMFKNDFYIIPWRAYLEGLSKGKGFKERNIEFSY